jgi:iron(III) transport system ATP-binding protein
MLLIDKLSHQFNESGVLKDISFRCDSGQITCLIGPSGCGKTTLLRLVAGLLRVQRGQISLDGTALANPSISLPPEQRSVGMVFQEGALFPHMSVADNIAFGLTKKTGRKQSLDWLNRVGLPDMGDRFPDSLSGGQRQRVALARALAPEPRVLLFDEPYANLDVPLRRALREDAWQIIRNTGSVGLFVTHDPDEVLAMADRVVVLDSGAMVETGTPQSLYDAPTSAYGAQLFGDPQVLNAVIDDEGIRTDVGVWDRSALIDPTAPNGAVRLVVNADNLLIAVDSAGFVVEKIRAVGRFDRIYLRSKQDAGVTVVDCVRPEGVSVEAGMRVRIKPLAGSVFAEKRQ